VTKQSYFTVTWGRHIYIKTIENILLNVFKHQKYFSLFKNIPHIPMCGGSERFVCACVCFRKPLGVGLIRLAKILTTISP